MRILVTGATGFVGSHVLQRLSQDDSVRVAILVRPESARWRIQHLLARVEQIVGDTRDPQDVAAGIRRFAPDVTIHLAWAGVQGRYRNDPSLLQSNLMGSLELLKVVQEAGCRAWIGLGSQAEYAPSDAPLQEEAPTHPTTLYGATKLALYHLSEQLCALGGTRFVWVRLFSVYGPMEDEVWMIPSLILTLLRGERPSLTEGRQQWDYLYVGDAAEAIYRAAVTSTVAGVFNLGSGDVCRVRQIAEHVRDIINPALALGLGDVPYRADQVMRLQADITAIRRAAGWSPATSSWDGLVKTVEWYRIRLEGHKIQ